MAWKQRLKATIEDSDTRSGRIVDCIIQSLIVLSLVTFSLETLPNLPEKYRTWLRFAEVCCVVVFTLEYSLRLFVADRKTRFVFSFYGIVDLVAILPFFLGGHDLRSARVFRLFRLLRIFKFARYSKAMQRYAIALRLAKEELVLYLVFTLFVLFLSAAGIHAFESRAQPEEFASVFHCLWWSVVTFTTVGYGDVYPITLGGRIFTGLILLAGLGIISVPAGIFASALSEARKIERH